MARFVIKGRTALVTGGSAGIGQSLTRQLLAEGAARVLVVGRDAARLRAIETEGGGKVEGLMADLGDQWEVDQLLADLPALAPELSLLFNNAGSQRLMDFTHAKAREHLSAARAEIAVNFTGVVALSVGLLPLLARQPSAAIVNVTSGLALAPKKSSPVYCATKAGIRSFTRALRYQCEDRMPHVHVVEAVPPLVDTAMTQGRGRGKISPDACAAQIIAGLRAGRVEILVGKSRLLHIVMRASPALGHRLMRDG
jgi:uncharacterized oxidoreductase